jgi:hypothetical protein
MRSLGKAFLIFSNVICLGFYLRMMVVLGTVADTHNVGAAFLAGGSVWLYMEWLRLLLLLVSLVAACFWADRPVVVLLSQVVSLLLSLKLTYNAAIAIDELGLHAAQYYGSTAALYGDWGMLGLMLLSALLSLLLMAAAPQESP